jgi:hypothetical protein
VQEMVIFQCALLGDLFNEFVARVVAVNHANRDSPVRADDG